MIILMIWITANIIPIKKEINNEKQTGRKIPKSIKKPKLQKYPQFNPAKIPNCHKCQLYSPLPQKKSPLNFPQIRNLSNHYKKFPELPQILNNIYKS